MFPLALPTPRELSAAAAVVVEAVAVVVAAVVVAAVAEAAVVEAVAAAIAAGVQVVVVVVVVELVVVAVAAEERRFVVGLVVVVAVRSVVVVESVVEVAVCGVQFVVVVGGGGDGVVVGRRGCGFVGLAGVVGMLAKEWTFAGALHHHHHHRSWILPEGEQVHGIGPACLETTVWFPMKRSTVVVDAAEQENGVATKKGCCCGLFGQVGWCQGFGPLSFVPRACACS